MKRSAISILILCLLATGSYRPGLGSPQVQIFDSAKPVVTIGGDLDDPKARAYRAIDQFTVDRSGSIYIANDIEFTIDKYDQLGRLLSAVGRKGQGPGEFEPGRRIPSFGVDSNGLIYTSSLRSKIVVLNPDGSLNGEHDFPAEAKGFSFGAVKVAPDDSVHILFYRSGDQVLLMRFSRSLKDHRTYHRSPARRNTALGGYLRFLPDFDFDSDGNVYVTDGFEYRLFVYGPGGGLLRTVERPFQKSKITTADLVLYGGAAQGLIDFSKDPNAVQMLGILSKAESYLPPVFGINVFDGGFILWTSSRDADLKYIFDIYDKSLQMIGSGSAYNWVCQNSALIRKGRIYLPDMGSDDREFKKKLGRLSLLEMPSQMLVYEVSFPRKPD